MAGAGGSTVEFFASPFALAGMIEAQVQADVT